MSIETIRAEIRGIEQEIQILQDEPMTQESLEAIHECFERKWELEKQVKAVA